MKLKVKAFKLGNDKKMLSKWHKDACHVMKIVKIGMAHNLRRRDRLNLVTKKPRSCRRVEDEGFSQVVARHLMKA